MRLRSDRRYSFDQPPAALWAALIRVELFADGEGAGLRLVSELSASSALLRIIADVARPVVQFGHDWVLDTGLRQFAERAL